MFTAEKWSTFLLWRRYLQWVDQRFFTSVGHFDRVDGCAKVVARFPSIKNRCGQLLHHGKMRTCQFGAQSSGVYLRIQLQKNDKKLTAVV